MKVFSSCMPFSFLPALKDDLSIEKLNRKLESGLAKNGEYDINACHKAAIQISAFDKKITKKVHKKLTESLRDNYSDLYKYLMNIGECTLYHCLAIDLMESGFLNFVKEDGTFCHTAYLKKYNGSYQYYHTNYTPIDKIIVDKCGMAVMNQIKGTSISHYTLSADAVMAIDEFMSSDKWRVYFCPAAYLLK